MSFVWTKAQHQIAVVRDKYGRYPWSCHTCGGVGRVDADSDEKAAEAVKRDHG